MNAPVVLVVEDESDIRELIGYNLTKAGYQVVLVVTGEQALAAVKTDPPDLVVLDLMLPGIDGLKVCARLKQDVTTSEIPIVMLTAKGEEADVVRGLNLGADDYITKPFSPRVLIAAYPEPCCGGRLTESWRNPIARRPAGERSRSTTW